MLVCGCVLVCSSWYWYVCWGYAGMWSPSEAPDDYFGIRNAIQWLQRICRALNGFLARVLLVASIFDKCYDLWEQDLAECKYYPDYIECVCVCVRIARNQRTKQVIYAPNGSKWLGLKLRCLRWHVANTPLRSNDSLGGSAQPTFAKDGPRWNRKAQSLNVPECPWKSIGSFVFLWEQFR